ncbi:MAG: hypothetical protein ACRYFL_15580 [Janthinobacterium lividum]
MSTEPENQEKEETKLTPKDNEELAKEIPTVTPGDDNLEPEINKEEEDK